MLVFCLLEAQYYCFFGKKPYIFLYLFQVFSKGTVSLCVEIRVLHDILLSSAKEGISSLPHGNVRGVR